MSNPKAKINVNITKIFDHLLSFLKKYGESLIKKCEESINSLHLFVRMRFKKFRDFYAYCVILAFMWNRTCSANL